MNPMIRLAVSTALGIALASCGGGGGGGGGGPICTVAAGGGTIAVSGLAQFQRVGHTAGHALNYAGITAMPVRGATVEVRRGTATNTCVAGTILGTDTTDAAGNYSINVTQNEDAKVCVRAELLQAGGPTWNVQVVDNTSASAVYVLETAAFCSGTTPLTQNLTAATGWGTTSYTGPRAAAPFAILDSIYQAIQKILTVEPTAVFATLDLNWSVNNTNAGSGTPSDLAAGRIGTSFYSSGEIYILGDDNNDTDEFDDHVIIHEYGHYVEDNLSRSDSIGGSHSGGDLLDARVAYGEGFGNAWSGIVTDNPVYEDSFGPQQGQGFDINVESDTVTAGQTGWFSETNVQAVIYDLYDTTNEAGGSGDTSTIGLAALWNTWRNLQSVTPTLTTIFSLLDGARTSAGGSVAFINALAVANGIAGTDALGSGETNAGGSGNTAALPLYTAYTVGGGSVPICVTNNDGTYNALGNRRFLNFAVGSANRTFSVTAPAGTDVDAVLYNAGAIVGAAHQASGNESWAINPLAAGTYVLEVYACENVFPGQCAGNGTTNTPGNRCLTVSIN